MVSHKSELSKTFEWDYKVINRVILFSKYKIEKSVESKLHVVVLVSSI